MKKIFQVAASFAISAFVPVSILVLAGSVSAQSSIIENQQITYTGPFTNTTYTLSGKVFIKVVFEQNDKVSGYINFTNNPGVRTLCGAGNFTGNKRGRILQFRFISSDPDPGCGFDRGLVFTVNATLSPDGNSLENGSYQVNNARAGMFQAASLPCGDAEIQTNYDSRGTGTVYGYHHYEVQTVICSTSPGCTVNKVFEFMLSNAKYIAPVEFSKPVKTCMQSTVRIISSYPGSFFEGTILSVVDENAHSVTNFTRKDHPLHPGKVVRTVVKEKKSIIVKTVGDGTGFLPLLNESKAQDLWGNIDNQLKGDFNPKLQ